MRVRLGTLVVVVLCVATGFGSAVGSAESNPPYRNQNRSPILIDGDAGFTPENGVIGGSGTAGNPYLIAGWFVDVTDWSASAITVRNTTAYVLIDGINVYGGRFRSRGGIDLANVQHVQIRSLTVQYSSFGVRAVSSTDIHVSSYYLRANEQGVYIRLTSSAWIEANVIDGEGVGTGVAIESSQTVVIGNNSISQVLSAVSVVGSTNVLVQGNMIGRSGTPIEVLESSGVRIEGNDVAPLPVLALVPYRNMGFQLRVPQNWTLRENVGPGAVLRVSGPPLIYPAAIAVDTRLDFSIKETYDTLNSFVQDDLRQLEGPNPPIEHAYPPAYLDAPVDFRRIANHSAASFVVLYPFNNVIVKIVYIVSEANGRWWRLMLISQITNFAVEEGNFIVLNAMFERMLASFEITAAVIDRLSPLSPKVLVPVGVDLGIGVLAGASALPLLRSRGKGVHELT